LNERIVEIVNSFLQFLCKKRKRWLLYEMVEIKRTNFTIILFRLDR